MASIHTNSVREELDRIKSEFKEKSAAGKVSEDSATLINALIMLLEMVFAIFMEKTTKKTGRNSNKPSSQTGTDKTTKGSNGKGRQQNALVADNMRTVTTDTIITVENCQCCGESLQDTQRTRIERRSKIDIIFEKTVEHFDAEIKKCPSCDTVNKGTFPKGICGKLQYGDGLKAFIVHLIVSQMVTLNRVQSMISAMIGSKLSEATLLSYVLKLHLALESWEKSAIEKLIKLPCLYVDETSMKVDRKNHWIHVYAGGDVTVKLLHKKRGKEAITDNNIIPRYGGVLVHDCWASYLSYDHCQHGLCGSHLLRELTFIIDTNQYKWAINMKKLLKKTCKQVSDSDDKVLTAAEYALLQKNYRSILTRGNKELPEIPKKKSAKKGNIAKSDAHNLWDRLQKYEAAVLMFAKNPNVAFTNNRAERDLRMAKVKQKVSGCFRSKIYAEAYCRISSYLQTMANQGVNPLVAIQMALGKNIKK